MIIELSFIQTLKSIRELTAVNFEAQAVNDIYSAVFPGLNVYTTPNTLVA